MPPGRIRFKVPGVNWMFLNVVTARVGRSWLPQLF